MRVTADNRGFSVRVAAGLSTESKDLKEIKGMYMCGLCVCTTIVQLHIICIHYPHTYIHNVYSIVNGPCVYAKAAIFFALTNSAKDVLIQSNSKKGVCVFVRTN